MTKNIEIVKIETKGFYNLCERLKNLETKNKKLDHDLLEVCIHEEMLVKENKQLKQDNKVLSHELAYFKEYAADLEDEIAGLKARCRELSSENMALTNTVSEMKFTRKYLTSEDAGRQFAKELLGGA